MLTLRHLALLFEAIIAEIVIFSGYIKYKMSDDSGDEGFFNENFDEERLTILF